MTLLCDCLVAAAIACSWGLPSAQGQTDSEQGLHRLAEILDQSARQRFGGTGMDASGTELERPRLSLDYSDAERATLDPSHPVHSGDLLPRVDKLVMLLEEGGETGVEPGEEEGADLAAIAEAMNNPLGHLWMIFTQYDMAVWNGRLSSADRVMNTFVVQPVLPFSLTEEWKVIFRPTLPIANWSAPTDFRVTLHEDGMPNVSFAFDRETGLSDFVLPFWFSNMTQPPFVLGVGPTIMFPTATDDSLGSDKWSMGPSVLGMYLGEKWIVGGIFQHWWDFAGDSDAESVGLSDLYYIFKYKITPETSIGMGPNIRYNWYSDHWTIPVGGGFDTLFKVGPIPMRFGTEFHYFVEQSEAYGPDWQFRFFLIPVIPAPAFAKKPLFGGQ